MSSGQHFKTGVPLALTTSFTGSDVDTATVSIRLEDDRLLAIKKTTEPTELDDGPDFLKLLWAKPSAGLDFFELYMYQAGGWFPVKGVMDLSNSIAKTLPANRIIPGSNGQILATVPDVPGYKTAWIDKPEPYTLGLTGTVLMSNGYAGVFQDLQGEMVHSASVTGEIKPLLSDGTGTCNFNFLPAASVAPSGDTSVVTSLVSSFGAAPEWKKLSLIDTDSALDNTGTPATAGYVPYADGSSGIAWQAPKVLANDRYETSDASRVALSALTTIGSGNYNSTVVDSITWATKSPADLQVFLQCNSTQNGYSTGSRIPVSALTNSDGTKRGFFKLDASTSPASVTVVLFGKYVEDLTTPSGTASFVDLESTGANWKFVVVASKF